MRIAFAEPARGMVSGGPARRSRRARRCEPSPPSPSGRTKRDAPREWPREQVAILASTELLRSERRRRAARAASAARLAGASCARPAPRRRIRRRAERAAAPNDPRQSGVLVALRGGRALQCGPLLRGARASRKRLARAAGDLKTMLQGLIQVAVGLHHQADGNVRGALRLLSRGQREASPLPACRAGVDLEGFCIAVERIVERCCASRPGRRSRPLGSSSAQPSSESTR